MYKGCLRQGSTTGHCTVSDTSSRVWRRDFAYHDSEGAVGDINTTKAHIDDIGPWLGGRVENVIGAILIFNNISLSLSAVWGQNCAGHFPLPSSLGVHHEAHFFTSFHSGGNARAWKKVQEMIMEALDTVVLLA